MFDEYFKPFTIAGSNVQEAATPRAEVLADSLVLTSIDQDAPSTKSLKTPTFHDDPLNESPNEDLTSQGSSSNIRQIHTPFETPCSLCRFTRHMTSTNVTSKWAFLEWRREKEEVLRFNQKGFVVQDTHRSVPAQKGSLQSQTSTQRDGLLISQSSRGNFITKLNYAFEIVKKYGLHSTDSVDTPMIENKKLDEDLQGKQIDATLYHGMIGSLMYLTSSRPDLNHDVCLCALGSYRYVITASCRLLITWGVRILTFVSIYVLVYELYVNNLAYHDTINAHQPSFDLELVPKENRLVIGKCNGRSMWIEPREIFSVVLDALALTTYYPAFIITADVPEGRDFDALPSKEDTIYFLRDLGHVGVINSLNDVVVDQMHQPWRTFAALINRSLSRKTSALDKLRLFPMRSNTLGHVPSEVLYLPIIARKSRKASYKHKKDSDLVPVDEETITKGKRIKRSVKKSSTKPTTGIVIREPPVETKSKGKEKEKVDVAHGKGIELLSKVALTEKAQLKEVRKKSLRDFHKTHPSGSGTVAKKPPSVEKITPTVTSEGCVINQGFSCDRRDYTKK
ncbi:hypothetical protein Tco_0777059 [Tanacetum coccineum]